jgi:hypothetical protein
MSLVKLNLPIDEGALPRDVRAFLRAAGRRIERFQRERHVAGFVPSDFAMAYRALCVLEAEGAAPGKLFCEWGSGFGVVACLAAMVGFDACGIEIEGELVAAARLLADDFGLPVEFAHGSFIPGGSKACFKREDEFAWLTTIEGRTEEQLGLDLADFDVIFAYPWPDEERVTAALFEHHAGAGAVLLTYHGDNDVRLRRNSGRRSTSRRGPRSARRV